MEIGNEICQKIKAAIKAKLVELSAYVDDELPDYIMVMVANKKSQQHMSNDLNLFLGTNTQTFTSWLHGLLHKLQSITSENPKPNEVGTDPETSTIARVLDKSSLAPGHHPPLSTKSPATDKPPEVGGSQLPESAKQSIVSDKTSVLAAGQPVLSTRALSTDQPPVVSTSLRLQSTHSTAGILKPSTEKVVPVAKQVIQSHDDCQTNEAAPEVDEIEPDIRIRLEEDEFDEEIKQDNVSAAANVAVPVKRPKMRVFQASHSVKTATQTREKTIAAQIVRPTTQSRAVTVQAHPSSTISQRSVTKTSNKVAPIHISRTVTAKVINRPSSSRLQMERKRKAPGSTIGAVLRHDVEDIETKYDPYNPSFGNVASVVNVTARKSSVPPSLQANRNLLIKAMSEAKGSIESYTKKIAERAMVKPTVHKKEVWLPVRTQKCVRSPYQRQQRVERPPVERQRVRLPIKRTFRNEDRLTWHTVQPKARRVQLFSRSSREETLQRFRSGGDNQSEGRDLSGEQEEQSEEECLELVDPESPVMEYVEQPTVESETVIEDTRTYIRRPSSELASQCSPTEAIEDDDTIRIVQQRTPQQIARSTSPNFVVTLEGMDPEMIKYEAAEGDIEMTEAPERPDVREEILLSQKIASVKPQYPQIDPVMVNIEDEEEEYEEADNSVIDSESRSKSTERCRFWPSCKNGESCVYHHPNSPCKFFPNCQFGEKCLNIHPNCKFDANCTRPNCPYTHAMKRQPTAPAAIVLQPIKVPVYPVAAPGPSYNTSPPFPTSPPPTDHRKIVCRFHPRCTNVSCTYFHPMRCRFGMSCAKKQHCPYTHPKLPNKDQFTWSASAQPKVASSPTDTSSQKVK